MRIKNLLTALLLLLSAWAFSQTPTNWILDLANAGDGELSPNSEFFTEGTKACQITIFTDGIPSIDSDDFSVAEGDDYTFSLDVLDNDTTIYLKLYADFKDADGEEIWGETPVVVEDNANWQTITWSGTIPAEAVAGWIRVKAYDDEGFEGEASALVDNCHFEVEGSNLVQNFSFEEWGGVDLIKAYSTGEETVVAIFDGPVPSVNAGDYLLSGSVEISFATAVVNSLNESMLILSDPSEEIEGDMMLDMLTFTVTGTGYDFYAGISSVAHLNASYPDGTIMDGYIATFDGMVFANDDYNNFWINDDPGPYNGVMIFSYELAETVFMGDNILVAGKREAYYGITELAEPILIEVVSQGNNLFPAATITGANIASNLPSGAETAEKWEGQLVKIQNAEVLSYDEINFVFTCTDDDNATTFLIGDNVDYQFGNITINVGETHTFMGVVDYTWDQYRINPRYQADVMEPSAVGEHPNTFVTAFPNPASSEIHIRNLNQISHLTITDVSGRICRTVYTEGTALLSIDIAELRGGVYFVNFFGEN
nr:T9SS type A sorting domain-containing protein [Bacteroidota bacterium]